MLTVADAAKRANRDPETIRRWIRAGKLTSWKVGSQHVIDEDDLADAIRGRATRDEPYAPAEWAHRLNEAHAAYDTARSLPAPGSGGVTDAWLPSIVGRVARAVDPIRIILFGSRARGDQRPDSDYDLLVVLDEVQDRRAMRIAIRRSFEDLPVAADVLVATRAEAYSDQAGRPTGPVYWALKEGSTVYERGNAS